MKPSENDKKLDGLIRQAVGREKLEFDFDKWQQTHGKEIEIYKSQTAQKQKSHLELFDKWRKIMKSKITKLVAAAVIIIAVIFSITILDKTITPAYAIEQTIEAFKNVRFMHLIRDDGSGKIADERWIEIGMDGRQIRYRQYTPPNFLVIEDGKTTAVYHKDKYTVVLYDRKDRQYQWIGALGMVLENLRQEGKIIEENTFYKGQPAHKVLWPMLSSECYVDPQTKLPIGIGDTDLSYEQPPSETFEIVFPEDFVVIDKRPGAASAIEPDWLNEEKTANEFFHKARYALVEGKHAQAEEFFKYVVEKQPGRNWAWFWLGKAQYELGKYDLGIDSFSKVLEMMDDVPYCYHARGLAYAKNGMDEAAKEDLEKSLPWMIRTLHQPMTAAMFEYADNPLLREGKGKPTEKQIIVRMINRLRIITGQNFGYSPDATVEENSQAITAWGQWYENSGQIEFMPEAELIVVP